MEPIEPGKVFLVKYHWPPIVQMTKFDPNAKQALAFIAAGSDVVAAIGPWDAQRARHGVGANRTGGLMSRHKWIKM